MDKREWKRIEEIVDEALKYSGEYRAEYVNRACGNKSGLKKKVIKYLNAIESSKGFLEDNLDQ